MAWNLPSTTVSTGIGYKVIGSILTNPSDTDIVVDTGVLPSGEYLLGFIVSTTVAAAVLIEHRNAANNGNIDAMKIIVPTAGTDYPIYPSKITIAQNQQIRLTMSGGITGGIQGGIFYLLWNYR